MTRAEFEQRKRRLEEQLEEGIELLKAGFRQQLRALELVWMTTADEDGGLPRTPIKTSAPPQAAKSSRRPRLRPGQLWDDVDAALDRVPRVFDRHDLLKALGYEPDRASLHRVMTALLGQGAITLKTRGFGKIPSKYEKAEAVGEIEEAGS
jgi:hypothetical protein